jgi:ABC-2 type transport system ATP-binding protein
LHDPPVLFLDEPTLGVDPVGARELRGVIAGLAEAGKTVLLTTHYMFEADALCDRIAVIAGGRLVAEGTPQQLKAGVRAGRVVEIEVFGDAEGPASAMRTLTGVRAVTVTTRDQAQLITAETAPEAELTYALLAHLDGAAVGRVAVREPTLEDAYVALVREA